MIELTVKTLDSQNHAFTVDDDITVAQFKEKIAETVNIPADTQRIIYCGRVLQDASKLNDYDVNGKVVHLVQRPPPSANQPAGRDSPPPQPQPYRRIRGLEYLGSMRFPATSLEQNMIPPLPTHSLAASRLNVAKRMLRRAELVLNALENPTARASEQPAQEEQQDDVTPVFEARVIVPTITPNEPIDEAVVLSAVQDSLMNVNALQREAAAASRSTPTGAAPLAEPEVTSNSSDVETTHSVSSTPEVISPLATSAENLTNAGVEQTTGETADQATNSAPENGAANRSAAGNNTAAADPPAPENVSHTAEYAELLDTLNRFQMRFAPYLGRYNNFMREDPTVTQENARPTQAMINRVSEILHYLGHAYHSLSDIIVRVRTPPPRPLLCRPILIQHSAIVQAGIPIQVEAQINFSANHIHPQTTTSNGARPQPPNTATTTSSSQQTVTSTATNATTIAPGVTVRPIMGFPFGSGAGVHVEALHMPPGGSIRNLPPGPTIHMPPCCRNNNRDNPMTAPTTTVEGSDTAPAVAGSSSKPPTTNPSTDTTAAARDPGDTTNLNNIATALASSFTSAINNAANATNNNTGNPNVEFFMEVTPEALTIDSLESAFVTNNQSQDGGGTSQLNPPPELIQSIMQMAGQLFNHGSTVIASPVPDTTSEPAPVTDSQGTTNGGAARTTPFQNSQARGNTQTQPTTSTQTRSTARPHVHLAQHTMQGFDPFLPCNSHHVTPRRRGHHHQQQQQQNSASRNTSQRSQQDQTNNDANRPGSEGTNQPRNMDENAPLYNTMRRIMNTVRAAYISQGAAAAQPGLVIPGMSASGSNVGGGNEPQAAHPWMPNVSVLDVRTPTIAQLLQQLPEDSIQEGENIFTDLVMLLSRSLTIGDIFQLNGGRLEPLMRIRPQLRNFVLYRILDGTQTTQSVNRGIDRLMGEMEPIIDHLALMNTRDDIDITRSVQTLLRSYLPAIITLAASPRPNALKLMMVQLRTTAKYLCALMLRASRNGHQDVENIFNIIVTRYMQGIPRDLQQWTLMTSRTQLSTFLATLNVPDATLQPYIIKHADAVITNLVQREEEEEDNMSPNDVLSKIEPMQVDEEPESGSNTEEILPPLEPDPLPEVVLGSESWHGQVPADWVPIITRDSQRQRRQNPQPPFSDAYLSGMPSKRRKIVTNTKPQGSLPQVISESVRRAITTNGLHAVTSIDTVAEEAGSDDTIRLAYRDLLRTSIRSRLSSNEDFVPERFPNASNYFNSH